MTEACCKDFERAQEMGTDNESYGPLLSWLEPENMYPRRERGWYIGDGLQRIGFCPWCGTRVQDQPGAERG